MGLTSAMLTGLSGLNANQTRVETIGNNIANVNTTAFKGSRTLFQTQFSETLSMGTPPSTTSGGTNPMQIGHGVLVGTTQRMFANGSVETTGLPSDLAVEGAGYFVVQTPSGGQFYTRDGAFALNDRNELVTADGNYVRGYGVDQSFHVASGQLQNLQIPVGSVTLANATTRVTMDGDLSATSTIATQGSQHLSQALVSGGGAPAAAGTALADVRSASDAATPLFAAGDVITVSGASRGGHELPARQFTVGTDGNTLGDFATWLQTTLGIQTDPALVGAPGVTVQNGVLTINSNAGDPNAITIASSNILSSNAGNALPVQLTEARTATGNGVYTSFTVYDSLGNPVVVDATFTLESLPNSGPVWRYLLQTTDSGVPQTLGTGTLAFDPQGNFVSTTGNQMSVDRSGSGAASPLAVTLDFSRLNGLSTQTSSVIAADQDGFPPGTLAAYNIGTDGVISGVFSNGATRTLGQIVLATFANEAGLVAETDNLVAAGPNSGPATVVVPGTQAAGTVRGGALEMSNVDLAREFIGLITSSTAFQANSRVISVSNDMLDQLLMVLR